jgi:hypothetical protein
MKRLAFLAVVVPLISFGLPAPRAQAGFIVTLLEQGTNVVATGSGTIDLTGLSFFSQSSDSAFMIPISAEIVSGPVAFGLVDDYGGVIGPTSFGSGGGSNPSSGSGDHAGLAASIAFSHFLELPHGYVSGHSLSDTDTYDNQTFSSSA